MPPTPEPSARQSTNKKPVSLDDAPATRVVRSGGNSDGVRAWQIPVKIGRLEVNAVVDTAAEITIISERVFDRLSWHPELDFRKKVSLAGDGATMSIGFLGNIELEIGNSRFPSTPDCGTKCYWG